MNTTSDRIYIAPTRKGCKRCGSHTVAWQQGKNDRWYLTEVWEDIDGANYTYHNDLHSKYCVGHGHEYDHEQVQLEKLRDEQAERDKREAERERIKADAEAKQIEHYTGLMEFCERDPEGARAKVAELQKELDHEEKNYVSMDYFTEHCKQQDKVKHLRVEISFMQGWLSDREGN